jgi:hypothetical protein
MDFEWLGATYITLVLFVPFVIGGELAVTGDAAEIKNALQQSRKRMTLPTKLALVSPQIQSFTPAAGT